MELLATLIDSVNWLRAELAAGIAVVQVKRTHSPHDPEPYPRPSWVERSAASDGVMVIHPRIWLAG